MLPRVGIGVDVHAYGTLPPLWLAGLEWPDEVGLVGHSDGDVAAHAACDALLGAAGLGDLGAQFGTDRPELAGASGAALLAATARSCATPASTIGNVAVQVIGNRPHVASRRAEAERVLSAACGAPVTRERDHDRRPRPHRPRRGPRRPRHRPGPAPGMITFTSAFRALREL